MNAGQTGDLDALQFASGHFFFPNMLHNKQMIKKVKTLYPLNMGNVLLISALGSLQFIIQDGICQARL